MLRAKKIVLNFSGVIAGLMLLFTSCRLFALENVTIATIEPHPRVKGRDIWYNVRTHSSGPFDHASPQKLNFSVDVNAKAGEYIEVTFTGSVAGNGIVYIKADVPSGGTSPLCKAGCSWEAMTGSPFGEEYNPGSPPYRPYAIKAIYQARSNGIIRFRQVFWRAGWATPSQFWPGYMTAFAEIINPPIFSP